MGLVFKDNPIAFDNFAEDTKFNRLPCVIQNWIRNVQVYNRPNRQKSDLNILNDIWNHDKHRTAALIAAVMPGFGVGTCPGEFKSVGFPSLKNGTAIGEYRCEIPDDIRYFEPGFMFDVAFPEGGGVAHAFLRRVEKHIRQEIIPKFVPFLTEISHDSLPGASPMRG
jgi:hypothetical protein